MESPYINPLTGKRFRVVGAPLVKKDAKALVTGKPVYADDLAPKDCLIVKVLRSPYAHALITDIDCSVASRIPGIECILTWRDVPQKRFTMAGQTFPEPSPYDRLILDRRLRFVGDAVAIVAGETEAAVDHAMRLIRVKYQVLEPVLDMHDAKDSHILVHPEDNWQSLCNVGADNSRNLCASGCEEHGDLEAAFAGCSPCCGQGLSHKGKPAGHDGNLPGIYLYGCIWPPECGGFHPDHLPCTPHHGKCPGYAEVKDQGHQAQDWRRVWRKADSGG